MRQGFGRELFHLEEVSLLAGAVDQEDRSGVWGVRVAQLGGSDVVGAPDRLQLGAGTG